MAPDALRKSKKAPGALKKEPEPLAKGVLCLQLGEHNQCSGDHQSDQCQE
jgi:hypothetical protein